MTRHFPLCILTNTGSRTPQVATDTESAYATLPKGHDTAKRTRHCKRDTANSRNSRHGRQRKLWLQQKTENNITDYNHRVPLQREWPWSTQSTATTLPDSRGNEHKRTIRELILLQWGTLNVEQIRANRTCRMRPYWDELRHSDLEGAVVESNM